MIRVLVHAKNDYPRIDAKKKSKQKKAVAKQQLAVATAAKVAPNMKDFSSNTLALVLQPHPPVILFWMLFWLQFPSFGMSCCF